MSHLRNSPAHVMHDRQNPPLTSSDCSNTPTLQSCHGIASSFRRRRRLPLPCNFCHGFVLPLLHRYRLHSACMSREPKLALSLYPALLPVQRPISPHQHLPTNNKHPRGYTKFWNNQKMASPGSHSLRAQKGQPSMCNTLDLDSQHIWFSY